MKKTSKAPVKNVDEYLLALPENTRAMLGRVRKAIRSAAPNAEEKIGYHMPMYKYKGHLVAFCAFTNHCSFFAMSYAAMKTCAEELKDFDHSGGTIRFTQEKPLPVSLIKKIVKVRILENDFVAAEREKKKQARAAAKKTTTRKAAKRKTAAKKTSATAKRKNG